MTIKQITELNDRPNILLFGVGHSGTTILAKMMGQLGWNLGQSDGFGENVNIRRVNENILLRREGAIKDAFRLLNEIPQPWIIKDPRFVLTLADWMAVFKAMSPRVCPAMLFLTRAREKMERSYVANNEVKDGVPFMYGHTVHQLSEISLQGYHNWPFRKLHVAFEQVIEATKLFNVTRASCRDSPLEANSTAAGVANSRGA